MARANVTRAPSPTDEQLLSELRALLVQRGRINASLIDASAFTRNTNAYVRRFGSLTAAYALIGYEASDRQRAAARRARKP